MNPIINPHDIYIVGILGNLRDVFMGITVSIGFLCLVLVLVRFTLSEGDATEKIVDKWIKRSIVVFFVTIPTILFVPEKKVLYQMLIVSKITPENVNSVTLVYEKIINDIDKIINKGE